MKLNLIFTYFTFFTVALRGQAVFTLPQCLEAAEKNQPIARQKAILDASQNAANQLLDKNWWPQIALGGQATYQTAVTSLPIKFPGIDVPTLDKDQYKITLDALQPIYDGGQNNAQKSLQNAQNAVEMQRVSTELYAVRQQIISLFCADLLTQKQSEVFETTKKDLISRKKRLDEQLKNGTAIPANLQTIEARLLELEQQADEAQTRQNIARDGLQILTGLTISANDKLETPENFESKTTSDDAILRPELSLFSLQQKFISEQSNLIKTKTMPRVNAIGTLGYGKPGLNFLENKFKPYAIFGVNFKWNLMPVFNQSVKIERQQIRLQSDRISAQRDQFLLQTNFQKSQQNNEITRLEKLIATDQKIIALRKNIASTAAVQLENGVLTTSDYLTETTNETNAQLAAAIHEIQLLQARLNLSFITGKR
jgi:outer membrane protein TolC